MSTRNSERNKYLNGPLWWSKRQFWNEPGRNFSDKAKDYYDKWLNDMWASERNQTKLEDKLS